VPFGHDIQYKCIMPYLKGFYLTLSAHLPQRDNGGWKKTDNQWAAYVHQKLSNGNLSVDQAVDALRPPDFNATPITVKFKTVERLLWDGRALSQIAAQLLICVCVRSNTVHSKIRFC
jgi:hypothetical protein